MWSSARKGRVVGGDACAAVARIFPALLEMSLPDPAERRWFAVNIDARDAKKNDPI